MNLSNSFHLRCLLQELKLEATSMNIFPVTSPAGNKSSNSWCGPESELMEIKYFSFWARFLFVQTLLYKSACLHRLQIEVHVQNVTD